MNEIMQTVFGLLGGLAIFLFGMNMMSEGLQKVAGEKMRHILGLDRKSTRLNSSHVRTSRMPSSA